MSVAGQKKSVVIGMSTSVLVPQDAQAISCFIIIPGSIVDMYFLNSLETIAGNESITVEYC